MLQYNQYYSTTRYMLQEHLDFFDELAAQTGRSVNDVLGKEQTTAIINLAKDDGQWRELSKRIWAVTGKVKVSGLMITQIKTSVPSVSISLALCCLF